MKHDRNRRFPLSAIRARGTEMLLGKRARELAPRVAAGTPVDKGSTQRSTSVETGHKSASGDRPAARIVQRGRGTKENPGAPVPANFRTHRDYMLRALGGG